MNTNDKVGGEKTSTLICRISPKTKAAWVKEAQKNGKKLTQWVEETLNANVSKR